MPQARESIQAKIVAKLVCPRNTNKGFLCDGCYRSNGIPLKDTERIVQGVLGILTGYGPTLPCERMNLIIPTLGPLIEEYIKK